VTALGADLVFLIRTVDKRTMDIMLGFSARVTVTRSFWLLLLPAIEIKTKVGMGSMAWAPAFASLVANLQMTIFSLKFEVSCLHLPTIII
jgi:zinc transporter, ZIP family